jgi:heat shock protein HslJ
LLNSECIKTLRQAKSNNFSKKGDTMKPTLLLLLSLVLLLAACTTIQTEQPSETKTGATATATTGTAPPSSPPSGLLDSRWQLVSFGPVEATTTVSVDTTITLEFGTDGQAGGHGGCNSYGAPYTVQEGRLMFGEIASTLIACADQAVNDQEQRYLEALRTAGHFTVAGDTLTIWYEHEKGVLNFVRASTPTSVPPQSRERVNFAPDATSAMRSGDLPAGGMKGYVLWAAAGQSMHVQTVGYNAPVEFILAGPNGETWPGEPQPSDVYIFTVQVILPQTGDYAVTLSVPPAAGATRYDVIFTVSANSQPSTPPPVVSPERVNFAPGTTFATRSGDLPAGGVKEYVLWASAGQSMHIQTVGYDAPVEFTLNSPNGEIWSGEPQPSDVYIFTVQVVLPHTGDYRVRLSAPPDTMATHYDVTFTITSPRSIQ